MSTIGLATWARIDFVAKLGGDFYSLLAKLSILNLNSPGVVSLYSDPQRQEGEHYSYLIWNQQFANSDVKTHISFSITC